MATLTSGIDPRVDGFRRNRDDMVEMLDQIDELLREAAGGGGEEAMTRLRSRGKLPIRERIAKVLDRDSPFLEISPLAAWSSHFPVGSGFLLGIGVISGVECLILGHDPSVRAGAFNPFNGKKLMRGLEIARENRLPYVQFVESAGADLRASRGRFLPPCTDGSAHHFCEQASDTLVHVLIEAQQVADHPTVE